MWKNRNLRSLIEGGVKKSGWTKRYIRDFTTTPLPIPNIFLVVYLLNLRSECLVSYDPHFPGKSSQVKFLLSTQIQNSPPLVPGAGSLRRKSQLRLCPGETLHRERSGLTTTCGCLFGFVYKRKPTAGEIYQRRELSARAAFFLIHGGSIN